MYFSFKLANNQPIAQKSLTTDQDANRNRISISENAHVTISISFVTLCANGGLIQRKLKL